MRISTRPGIAVSGVMLLLVAALTALFPASASAQSRVVFHSASKGMMLSADGTGTSADGSILKSYTVTAIQNRGELAQVDYLEMDYNVSEGTSTWLFGTAVPTALTIPGSLASAHLLATILLVDEVNGGTAGTTTVDLTWVATGPVSKFSLREWERLPGGYLYTSILRGTGRPAEVSGSFSGTGEISSNSNVGINITAG